LPDRQGQVKPGPGENEVIRDRLRRALDGDAGMTRVHGDTARPHGRQEDPMIDPAFTLEKKVAVVVGAANGIGRAIALAFAAAGAAVACADVEEPGAKATAAEVETGGARALPAPLDVTDGASCRAAVAATVQEGGYTAV
jgi:hypothetical protein